MLLTWLQALGEVLAGVGALAAAFVAVFAIRRQVSASERALAAQAQATRDARDHERRLAAEDRLWARRADLYSRATLAMREHLDRPVDKAGKERPLADVSVMASLVGEAEILASSQAKDLLNEFVYDDPDRNEKINLWAEFQILARRELTAAEDPSLRAI
ncbi:hypothetical protein [Micromonospora sp. NPDC005173]|uniref:hypothetical protein n=1 Tax=Micromonospora sp. NPDC005173 TaxID=3157165 RepID=UPI0033A45D11